MTDFALPFMIESAGLRGRIVKLDTAIDQILQAHSYLPAVAQLTAETTTLAVLLGTMLKYEGIFTLQTQSDGLVKMLVSDYTSAGDVRACAKVSDISALDSNANLLGNGHMAFTVDQGTHTERYQGIVALKNGSLLQSIQDYFVQSEQIRTGIKLAVGQVDGQWRGAAIMIQDMPEEGGLGKPGEGGNVSAAEDDWRRIMILLQSCTDDELLSSLVNAEELLFRLFHEEGVRVFDSKKVQKNCRCTMEKVEGVLTTLSDDDIQHLTVDGKISMTCEFCSREFAFDPTHLDRKIN